MLILAVVALWITLLVSPGIITYWIMQPNVVYEELPTIPIAENESSNTEQQPSMSSVTCVVVKNTGHSPASEVLLTIESENFFPDRTGLHPESWEYISHVINSDRNKKVYFLEKFAGGANFMITIPAPEEEPEIIISGMRGRGEKIEMKKSTPSNNHINWIRCLLFRLFDLPFSY